MKRAITLLLTMSLFFLLAACGAFQSAHTSNQNKASADAQTRSNASTVGKAQTTSANEPLPAWQKLPLTNVRTGEQLTLADFKGKTVFVETMATWCGNCRQQLTNVGIARKQLNNPDVVFIAVSVETDLAQADLAKYAKAAEFDWFFAVSTPNLLNELVTAFGRTIATPPATPHFVIHRDGNVSKLITGIDSPEQIVKRIQGIQGN